MGSPCDTLREAAEVVASPFLQRRKLNSFGEAWRMWEAQTTPLCCTCAQWQQLTPWPHYFTLVAFRMVAVIPLSPELVPWPNLPLAPPCLCHLTSWGCALSPRALKVKRLECFSSTISFLHICTWWRSRFILILLILLLFSGVWISIPAYFFVYALSYKRRLLVFFFFLQKYL